MAAAFQTLHPFAYMMHTHRHGYLVSSWRVKRDLAGTDQWNLIGKRDPRQEQSFFPIDEDQEQGNDDRSNANQKCLL